MAEITEFIVLHTTKYGENSLVVHSISRDYGRRSFLVRNVGKNKMALFLPLNVLEAEVSESSKSTLYSIRRISSRHPLNGMRGNMYKNAMTMFMSEVLYRVLREGVSEHEIYQWCEREILLLDAMESSFSNFHLYFLLELSMVLGFTPSRSDIRPFVGEYYPVVEKLMTSSLAESMLVPLSGEDRNEIAGRILKYIEFHTESSVSVNSLKVLRELFV